MISDIYYFVKNPAEIWDLEGIFTGEWLFFWNYHVAGLCGIVFNVILLYLITCRTPTYLKGYGRMLLLSCCADVFYLLVDSVCQAVIFPTTNITLRFFREA